jgi:hypothetical protein
MNHINISPNHIPMNFNQNSTISSPVLPIQTIPMQALQTPIQNQQMPSPISMTNPNVLQPTSNKIVSQQYQEVPKQIVNRVS